MKSQFTMPLTRADALALKALYLKKFGRPFSLPDEELIQPFLTAVNLPVNPIFRAYVLLMEMNQLWLKNQESLARFNRKTAEKKKSLPLNPDGKADQDVWSNLPNDVDIF